jgi:hypothetical protein
MEKEQMDQWKTEGYCVIHNFFEEEITKEAVSILKNMKWQVDQDEFGSGGFLEFPCSFDLLNDITLHPRLIKAAQQLLGTEDIRLMQSDYWKKVNSGKIGMYSNNDQRMHMDYPNNYLTHPNEWFEYSFVIFSGMIL